MHIYMRISVCLFVSIMMPKRHNVTTIEQRSTWLDLQLCGVSNEFMFASLKHFTKFNVHQVVVFPVPT